MEATVLMVSMVLLALVMGLLERVLKNDETRSRRSESGASASHLQRYRGDSDDWVITESETGDSDQERLVSQIKSEAPGEEAASDRALPAACGIDD